MTENGENWENWADFSWLKDLIVSLSKDVNRKWSFFLFLDGGFAQMFGQIVSLVVKTLRNTNLVASRCFKMKKTSLPVDVRRSKTPLFKLCIICFCHPLSRIESYFSLQ